jgi:hypothetical protein
MDPLHGTIEKFAADGYTHVECFCPRCKIGAGKVAKTRTEVH